MKKIINAELPAYKFDDYVHWQGDWELINGIPYSKLPASTFLHQSIASLITFSLSNSIKNTPECFVLSQLARIFHDNAEFWDNLGEAVCSIHRKA
jgi:hypothetical protein